jgi:hypothetical protein
MKLIEVVACDVWPQFSVFLLVLMNIKFLCFSTYQLSEVVRAEAEICFLRNVNKPINVTFVFDDSNQKVLYFILCQIRNKTNAYILQYLRWFQSFMKVKFNISILLHPFFYLIKRIKMAPNHKLCLRNVSKIQFYYKVHLSQNYLRRVSSIQIITLTC